MKIRINFILTSLIVFFISSTSLAQTDTTRVDSNKITFDPQFSGTHFEVCYILLGIEVGGLVDIDLIRNKKTQLFSLGYRASFEYYGYGDPGGGKGHSYLDLCFYVRPALRFNWFWINALGGLAYHTGNRESGEILLRGSFELKYIPFGNFVGVMLKGSTSFGGDSGFIGLGIALGYFN